MKLCNDVITVFRAQVDPDTGGNAWTGTAVTGVSWYMTDAVTLDASKGGLVAAGKVIVRIPEEAAGAGFTVGAGDIIVRGDASEMADPTPASLKAAYGADCMTVLGVTDNRRAPRAPHWRVTGT